MRRIKAAQQIILYGRNVEWGSTASIDDICFEDQCLDLVHPFTFAVERQGRSFCFESVVNTLQNHFFCNLSKRRAKRRTSFDRTFIYLKLLELNCTHRYAPSPFYVLQINVRTLLPTRRASWIKITQLGSVSGTQYYIFNGLNREVLVGRSFALILRVWLKSTGWSLTENGNGTKKRQGYRHKRRGMG